MYYDRVLTPDEIIYEDRAKQKIADLSAALAEEYSRNDTDEFKAQLIIELQYSIEVLKSTDLVWTEDQIQEMTDYYTIHASLSSYGFVGFDYTPIGGSGSPGAVVYATIEQLNAVEQDSVDRDTALGLRIDQEVLDRIAGDDALQAQIDLFGSGGSLTLEIISQINLGAIYVGQVFPIGTAMEDIWVEALKAAAVVSDFTFDSFAAVHQVGVGFDITQFTWTVAGTPLNLKLTDSEGIIVNQAVAGSSYTPGAPVNYPLATSGPVTWTLSGDNIEDQVITVDAWYLNYYGKEATADDNAVTVTEAKILAGTSQLLGTDPNVGRAVSTTAGEQGFIAVPKVQTNGDYTKWIEQGANQSEIAVGDFIRPPVDVTVGGVIYSVYRWGYRSPLTGNLTLYK